MPRRLTANSWRSNLLVVCLAAIAGSICAEEAEVGEPAHRWRFDPRARDDHFPIGVWLQHPGRADRYREAGINLYIGLWEGPTEEQLEMLRKARMPVICSQNEVGLAHASDPVIVGWLQQDEPDNAQSLGEGKGYGPPVSTEQVVATYERLRDADPSRPVLLNLGQGVAWDGWKGRGVRTGHPEDYPAYAEGGDIVSFDIYPVVHKSPEVAGDITFVARGIDRLRDWVGGGKHTWNCIECTHIQNAQVKPTPAQVRAEVWLSIIHGSRGIVYFVHEWEPRFNEQALLDDAEMLAEVSRTNHEIHALAAVINAAPTEDDFSITLASDTADQPASQIHVTSRRHRGRHFLFTVNTSAEPVSARVDLSDALPKARTVEVIGEGRRLPHEGGLIEDRFEPWQVHLYVWQVARPADRSRSR